MTTIEAVINLFRRFLFLTVAKICLTALHSILRGAACLTWLRCGLLLLWQGIKAVNPRSHFLSPEYQNWLVRTYFAIRADLYRTGIASPAKPLQCPVNLSSGVHALWLALQMCERINIFGFSWSLSMLGQRTDGSSLRVTGSHSWDFDTMVLKIMALAGKINICTQ
jgi:hypothetical protein